MSARCAIAASMKGVHYVLHAPQGDTYADLLFTMIERRDTRPPVTYTTFQARDLGSDTAEIFKTACREAVERFRPDAVLVGASCTAELIQDNPAGLAAALEARHPRGGARPAVLPEEGKLGRGRDLLPAGAHLRARPRRDAGAARAGPPLQHPRPRLARLSPPRRHRRSDEAASKASASTINVVAPLGATVADLARLPEADFNIVLYPEIAVGRRRLAEAQPRQPFVTLPPIGALATDAFVAAVARAAGHRRERHSRERSRACPGTRARSTRPISPASASSSSATRPMPSPPPTSRPRNSASRSAASAPTRANLPAKCARPPPNTASRR